MSIRSKIKAIVVGLLWISTHYITPHLYVEFCTPKNLRGFLLSPFRATSQECRLLRSLQNSSLDYFAYMKVVLTAWFIKIVAFDDSEKPD